MSRIDEALRRAREQANVPSPTAAAVATPDAVSPPPSHDVFVSPWEFQDHVKAGEPKPVPSDGGQPDEVPVLARPPASEPGALAPPVHVASSLGEKLVASGRMPGRSSEQYRKLAATLHQTQLEKNIRVVMLTSAVAGEGKTLTAANLALTLSESYGRNTLLVDADLRRPALHSLFSVPNTSGLSDGLQAGAGKTLNVQRLSARLSLLTAGRPDQDPTSVLTSELMLRVIEEAASAFDWVIVDTPPVGLVTDAKLLARMADAVLFVVHAASTPYDEVRRGVDAIGRERVLGVVLNRAPESGALGRNRYYYDRYYERRDGAATDRD